MKVVAVRKILVGRVPETREGIMKGSIREFKLGGDGWKGEAELV